MRNPTALIVLVLALAFGALQTLVLVPDDAPFSPPHSKDRAQTLGLPPEALATLDLIRRGGPFPYRQDGSTFQNRERLLPDRPRGYYREYTVSTPGAPDRGARRFVTGGDPPEVFYYTKNHYRSFRRVEIDR